MKEQKKNKFADTAKAILGTDKPTGIADFLDTVEDTTMQKIVNTENRKIVNTENRKETLPVQVDEPRTEREEFKLTKTLSHRLKKYAYEKDLKKVDVVTYALEQLFDREGY